MRNRLIPNFIKPYILIYREVGFKGLVKKGGIKLLMYVMVFYLIRDTILYVIPFLLAYYGLISVTHLF